MEATQRCFISGLWRVAQQIGDVIRGAIPGVKARSVVPWGARVTLGLLGSDGSPGFAGQGLEIKHEIHIRFIELDVTTEVRMLALEEVQDVLEDLEV